MIMKKFPNIITIGGSETSWIKTIHVRYIYIVQKINNPIKIGGKYK